ncbi:hydrophobin 2 [Phlebopus sp. FC_14]|nr:hydrophobin 2 [Phlebopus sp. FC_14]
MFKRVSVALSCIIVAFTAAVTAAGTGTAAAPSSTNAEPASQCNTGPIQCCNSASDPSVIPLLGLLGIDLSDLNVLVGLTCSPITVIGTGLGGSCSADPVCCENNNFDGLISIGCTPININL